MSCHNLVVQTFLCTEVRSLYSDPLNRPTCKKSRGKTEKIRRGTAFLFSRYPTLCSPPQASRPLPLASETTGSPNSRYVKAMKPPFRKGSERNDKIAPNESSSSKTEQKTDKVSSIFFFLTTKYNVLSLIQSVQIPNADSATKHCFLPGDTFYSKRFHKLLGTTISRILNLGRV